MKIENVVLDVILIVASVWMIFAMRGIGGMVGNALTFIVIGAVVLGVAHLQATLTTDLFGAANGTIHRAVVLVGFIFVAFGFQRIKAMNQ